MDTLLEGRVQRHGHLDTTWESDQSELSMTAGHAIRVMISRHLLQTRPIFRFSRGLHFPYVYTIRGHSCAVTIRWLEIKTFLTPHVHQVLQDVHHAGHLAEHQHAVPGRLEPSKEPVKQHHLAIDPFIDFLVPDQTRHRYQIRPRDHGYEEVRRRFPVTNWGSKTRAYHMRWLRGDKEK